MPGPWTREETRRAVRSSREAEGNCDELQAFLTKAIEVGRKWSRGIFGVRMAVIYKKDLWAELMRATNSNQRMQ